MLAGKFANLWSELRRELPAFRGLAVLSFVVTLLFMVPSVYLHLVYERVMQSRSFATLFAIGTITLFLITIWTALEVLRIKILQRAATAIDERISPMVIDAMNRQTDSLPAAARGAIVQDLGTLRDFISSQVMISVFDFMFVPLILVVAFLFHPIFGIVLLLVALGVGILAILSQKRAGDDMQKSVAASVSTAEFGRSLFAAAETVRSLGMLPVLGARLRDMQRRAAGWQYQASVSADPYTVSLRLLRHLIFPMIVTVGVILFIREEIGAGGIFAVMLLSQRAVYPVETVANSWRAFWSVRASAERIEKMLMENAKRKPKVALPRPEGPLVVSRVVAGPPNRDATILLDVSFSARPGQIVAVVGASGAGKSTLARILVGAWPVRRGTVTLDGHDLSHWDQDALGAHLGYVAQDAQLLPGTVAENIARFDAVTPERDTRLIEAVRLAGVEDLVSKLPEGLNTQLGPDGHMLSGGQKQRIALARAVYGRPRLVVLDEPNSNLDATGEQQLADVLMKLTESDAIVILVTHRMNMLSYCDTILVMNGGTVQAYGNRDQILERLSAYRPKELTDRRTDAGAGSVKPV
jgi:PrtD family type I secretion system ABC transporter